MKAFVTAIAAAFVALSALAGTAHADPETTSERWNKAYEDLSKDWLKEAALATIDKAVDNLTPAAEEAIMRHAKWKCSGSLDTRRQHSFRHCDASYSWPGPDGSYYRYYRFWVTRHLPPSKDGVGCRTPTGNVYFTKSCSEDLVTAYTTQHKRVIQRGTMTYEVIVAESHPADALESTKWTIDEASTLADSLTKAAVKYGNKHDL